MPIVVLKKDNTVTKLSVTIPDAVQMTGIGRSTLYKLFAEGKLTPRKSGKRTLVLVSELKQYVENLPEAKQREAA